MRDYERLDNQETNKCNGKRENKGNKESRSRHLKIAQYDKNVNVIRGKNDLKTT